MVSNYPQPVVSRAKVTPLPQKPASAATATFSDRMLNRVRQMICGLHGHDSLLHFEDDRMSLKCVSCGHESPGWELDATRPVQARATVRRQALVAPQLTDQRRIA